MAGLWLVIRRTLFGRNIRAVAENDRATALLGIRVRRSVLLVFVISSTLAGLAGLMVALLFQANAPSGWSEAFVWLAMIGTLVFLPEGLFGARVRRRTI